VLHEASFREPKSGRVLLRDISCSLPAGTATALTGPNGAGKSTLLRLLVGLLPPSGGAVRLDGVPVSGMDRSRLGYLPQGVHLLDGAIAENVARFADAPAESVISAAQAADVHEMIGRMRQGYESRIAYTSSLSGGQKQRVGLARALFGTPRLLVLDEPDASLDSAGEAALIQAIATARASGAVVVVATHRPKLLAQMDFTLALKDGRVEAFRARAAGERGDPVLPAQSVVA
jgi:ATP-binding cassette subfamily C protein